MICNPQQGSMLPFIWELKPKGMKIWCPSSDEPHQLFFHVVGYGGRGISTKNSPNDYPCAKNN